jgi:hypothetical protein
MKPLRTPSKRGEERTACRGDQSHRPFEIGQSRESADHGTEEENIEHRTSNGERRIEEEQGAEL